MATYVEPNTYGTEFYKTAGIPGSGHDAAIVRIEPSGAVSAQIGIVGQGQGHLTTVAQVLADELAVPIERVRVQAGDTAAAPYGMGTRGSRGGVVSAGAALGAARILKEKLLRIAAHVLEAPLGDLELADGGVHVRGAPAPTVTVAQLAQKAYFAPIELPPGMEPGLEATHAFDPPALTFSSGTHVCQVEIDAETGDVRIPRYTIVEDCGRLLNPRIVEGQLHGATAQGLAGALLEEVVYDQDGQNLSATYMDYAVPTASRVPPFQCEHIERPDPGTPLGLKGMAEGGVMGASAAIANAVADALAPLGVDAGRQPFTARRLAEAIHLWGGAAPLRPHVPPPHTSPLIDLCFTSAVELGRLIRRRAVSPVEITRAVLERIERLNPTLGAYVLVNPAAGTSAASGWRMPSCGTPRRRRSRRPAREGAIDPSVLRSSPTRSHPEAIFRRAARRARRPAPREVAPGGRA